MKRNRKKRNKLMTLVLIPLEIPHFQLSPPKNAATLFIFISKIAPCLLVLFLVFKENDLRFVCCVPIFLM